MATVTTYDGDLVKGTFYRVGVQRERDTQAQVRGHITLAPTAMDSVSGLIDASAVANTARGPNYPGNTNLKGKHITIRAIGTATAESTVVYFKRGNEQDNPKDTPTFDSGIYGFRRYTYNGSNVADFNVGTSWFYTHVQPVPTLRFRVAWSLTASPIGGSWQKTGSTNSDTVGFSETTFKPNLIRFDGVHQEGETVDGTTRYDGSYSFTLRPDTWLREFTAEGTIAPSFGTAYIGTVMMYGSTPFAGTNFPVSD